MNAALTGGSKDTANAIGFAASYEDCGNASPNTYIKSDLSTLDTTITSG